LGPEKSVKNYMSWGFESLKDVLSVLLIPVFLALLAPWIGRRWHERQRDTQAKTELVAAITDLVMRTVVTRQILRETQSPDVEASKSNEFESIDKAWRVGACVVGSKLHAYFPDSDRGDNQLHLKWNRFADEVTNFCEASDTRSKDEWERQKKALFERKADIIEEILRSRLTGFDTR
jgi:hypothetical protein